MDNHSANGETSQPTNWGAIKISGEMVQSSATERAVNDRLADIASDLVPRFGPQWNIHSLVTLKRQSISRLLYYNELYQKLVNVPGVICEFGVQWGATMAQLINLRGIYEPYNHSRKIIGFDTFEGFPSVHGKDGEFSAVGDYATGDDYQTLLEEILTIHESASPLSHIKKFELVRGDASASVSEWLERNPHAIIGMAIFDMDLYGPTKLALEAIKLRLVKGSLLVFDELNCPHFPGETSALDEVIGLNNLALRRFPHQTFCSWAVFGE